MSSLIVITGGGPASGHSPPGHVVTGPTEAFTPEERAAVYDTEVLAAHASIAPRCRT